MTPIKQTTPEQLSRLSKHTEPYRQPHECPPEAVIRRIAELEARVEELKDAAEAYQELAMCYRIGRRPSEKLMTRLDKAREALKQ